MHLFRSRAPHASVLGTSLAWLLLACSARGHEGPDPVAHWYFTPATVGPTSVQARLGPLARIEGAPRLVERGPQWALRFDGAQDYLVVDEASAANVPTRALTVAATVTVEAPQRRAAILGIQQVHAEGQKGWFLGYRDGAFCFGLASLGADDGNGAMTVIRATEALEPGAVYRVVGTYDGQEMRLYVNGALCASSRDQAGEIVYGARSQFVIGAALDTDEAYFHQGEICDVSVYDVVATEKWVAHDHADVADLLQTPAAAPEEGELRFVVTPYLQYVTQNSITVMWETNRETTAEVRFGLDGSTPEVAVGKWGTIHEIKLEGLQPQTGYYYRAVAVTEDGQKISSPLLSFQTANLPDAPFAFVVIGDTQFNPRVAKTLTDMMWLQRPNFVVAVGDLVNEGPEKWQWTEQFFPGMNPLISRVALFPVLGNHERNTQYYYKYMALPEPEYYYTFHYGNAQFFMLDSNKDVSPGSEQWNWLEHELKQSKAEWKFVAYHHPSYSSDEDDYGDMWRGRSEYGDLRLRPLSKLYDQYGVDIVWNGHIHSYERTWPLKDDKAVEDRGTIYVVTGGGGGGLEVAGPIKPFFQNNVKHGHHYCLAAVNGRTLEFKAFDMEGRLFDFLKIDKRVR
jgi:predicted phosphodiesterase